MHMTDGSDVEMRICKFYRSLNLDIETSEISKIVDFHGEFKMSIHYTHDGSRGVGTYYVF